MSSVNTEHWWVFIIKSSHLAMLKLRQFLRLSDCRMFCFSSSLSSWGSYWVHMFFGYLLWNTRLILIFTWNAVLTFFLERKMESVGYFMKTFKTIIMFYVRPVMWYFLHVLKQMFYDLPSVWAGIWMTDALRKYFWCLHTFFFCNHYWCFCHALIL